MTREPNKHYQYIVKWSEHYNKWKGSCEEFPELFCLDEDYTEALIGIMNEVVEYRENDIYRYYFSFNFNLHHDSVTMFLGDEIIFYMYQNLFDQDKWLELTQEMLDKMKSELNICKCDYICGYNHKECKLCAVEIEKQMDENKQLTIEGK